MMTAALIVLRWKDLAIGHALFMPMGALARPYIIAMVKAFSSAAPQLSHPVMTTIMFSLP